MIRIAICDDEKYMRELISTMVCDFFCRKNMEIKVLKFASGEELLKYHKTIDILFLDIQMKGMDGITTAKKLRGHNFKGFLIFITILKEMVFNSFEVQPYDYLVKPIEERRFDNTMIRLYHSIQNASEANLLVQKKYESRIVPLNEIVSCEIIDRKIYLHLTSSEIIDFYDRIEHMESKLDNRFYRCHRSFLINLIHLRSYKNGIAYMSNGDEIPVSRLRSKEFSKVIMQYMKDWRE